MRNLRAAAAPVPVYPVAGERGLAHIEDVMLHEALSRVESPRHASILLVAGPLPDRAHGALARLHDQLCHPRASVCWDTDPGPLPQAEVAPWNLTHTEARNAIPERLGRIRAELFQGQRPSEEALLPDEPPAPWRGRGDHGQGGEGMMGGKPYGRPMAMTGDDLRDGLSLDACTVTVGPFAPMLPPGLELELTLQGDVIQRARVIQPPFDDGARSTLAPHVSPGRRLTSQRLRSLARLLRVRGQKLLAQHVLLAARQILTGERTDVAALTSRLRWTGLLPAIEPGLGQIPGSGDVRSRVRRWMADAERAMASPGAEDASESSERHGGAPDAEALRRLLRGLEWGQAVTVLASFEVDALSRSLAGATA